MVYHFTDVQDPEDWFTFGVGVFRGEIVLQPNNEEYMR